MVAPATLTLRLWTTAKGEALGILGGSRQEVKGGVGKNLKRKQFSGSATPVGLEDFKNVYF